MLLITLDQLRDNIRVRFHNLCVWLPSLLRRVLTPAIDEYFQPTKPKNLATFDVAFLYQFYQKVARLLGFL